MAILSSQATTSAGRRQSRGLWRHVTTKGDRLLEMAPGNRGHFRSAGAWSGANAVVMDRNLGQLVMLHDGNPAAGNFKNSSTTAEC